jgi:hypothetical protein
MFRTTYYEHPMAKHPNAISISRTSPPWWKGHTYRLLAPPLGLARAFKRGGVTQAEYEEIYNWYLDRLKPDETAWEIESLVDDGTDKVPDLYLCCWCRPGQFCHRHLVAKWLHDNLGMDVEEVK